MKDLLFAQGQDNLAGLVDKIYIAAKDDIDSIPALAAAASLVTAAADIVMKTTKRFHEMYFTDQTAQVAVISVGEVDGKGRETTLSMRYPALGVALEDAIRLYQNTDAVLIFRLARNGKLYAIGLTQFDQAATTLSLAIPCKFESGEANSGAARADQNGALLSWKFTAGHGPVEYAGVVPLTPAG